MASTPDQLEREIAEVRADLAHTISLIEHKVSPKRVARDNLVVVIGVGVAVLGLITLKVVRSGRG